jgi:hypothetical protein
MTRQTKPRRMHHRVPQQIDLFVGGPRAIAGMPVWFGLPARAQAALIEPMTRLILDHAEKSRLGSMTEAAGHDDL